MVWRRYNTETVSHEVLARMKQLMVDNNTAASHSFLLDDDSSIPFSLDDIAALMEDKASASPGHPIPSSTLRAVCALQQRCAVQNDCSEAEQACTLNSIDVYRVCLLEGVVMQQAWQQRCLD